MLTRENADIHALYEESVQSVDEEVDFVHRVYKKHYGKEPLRLREDFCGTANFSAEWVRSDSRRTATGVDLDKKTLQWGEKHHKSKLSPSEQKRMTLHQGDVRDNLGARFDVVVAYNYSWWVFKTQADLLTYFKNARKSLGKSGLFFMDTMGGTLAEQVSLEPRKSKKFTYVWEQASFNPIDGNLVAHIHFEFKDGSRIDKAFTYDWRMWRLPEAREALLMSGFSSVDVYWENEDKRGNPNGEFSVKKRVENQPSYNAYIVAKV